MKLYRKKPINVQAVQWDGMNTTLIMIAGLAGERKVELQMETRALDIFTLEGVMRAEIWDWIIRGVQGEIYPCKADIFAQTYEEA